MAKPLRLAWMPAFLAALAEHGVVAHAARAAGMSPGAAYDARRRCGTFADTWDTAQAAGQQLMQDTVQPTTAARTPQPTAKGLAKTWRTRFFDTLAETSNVTAAAAQAGVAPRLAYKLRREDPEFAARWQAALREGYDNLEMELVGYLRHPQAGPKMDVAAALRLLAAHRATVERQRALASEEDEQATVESIDRFLEDMRQRRLANTAILAETEPDDGVD